MPFFCPAHRTLPLSPPQKQLTDLEDAEEAVLMAEDDGVNPAVM